MIAAPLATVDVPVDLPTSTATPQPRPADPVYLTLRDDLSPGPRRGRRWRARRSARRSSAATAGDREARIFLRADAAVAYGELMQVMNLLRGAGYLKVALVGLEAAGRRAMTRRRSRVRCFGRPAGGRALLWAAAAAAALAAMPARWPGRCASRRCRRRRRRRAGRR